MDMDSSYFKRQAHRLRAAVARSGLSDDPEVARAARRDFYAAQLAAKITEIVEKSPDFTMGQVALLHSLLPLGYDPGSRA